MEMNTWLPRNRSKSWRNANNMIHWREFANLYLGIFALLFIDIFSKFFFISSFREWSCKQVELLYGLNVLMQNNLSSIYSYLIAHIHTIEVLKFVSQFRNLIASQMNQIIKKTLSLDQRDTLLFPKINDRKIDSAQQEFLSWYRILFYTFLIQFTRSIVGILRMS